MINRRSSAVDRARKALYFVSIIMDRSLVLTFCHALMKEFPKPDSVGHGVRYAHANFAQAVAFLTAQLRTGQVPEPILSRLAADLRTQLIEWDGRRHATSPDMELVQDYHVRCLAFLLVSATGWPPSDDELAIGFERASKMWSAKDVPFELVVPLLGLDASPSLYRDGAIELCPDVDAMAVPTGIPTGYFPALPENFVNWLPFLTEPSSVALRLRVMVTKPSTGCDAVNLAIDRLRTVIAALRIAGVDAACTLASIAPHTTAFGYASTNWIQDVPELRRARLSDYWSSCTLDARLQHDCYKLVQAIPKSSARLQLAIARFGASFMHAWPANQLVDLAIALECLLIEGQTREKASRLVEEALARTADCEPGSTEALVKQIYDQRNRIVHDGIQCVTIDGASECESLDRVRDLTRHLIRSALDG